MQIFFPILQGEHYWLIVCDLNNPSFIVMDNSAVDEAFEVKYEGIPEKMVCAHSHFKSATLNHANNFHLYELRNGCSFGIALLSFYIFKVCWALES